MNQLCSTFAPTMHAEQLAVVPAKYQFQQAGRITRDLFNVNDRALARSNLVDEVRDGSSQNHRSSR